MSMDTQLQNFWVESINKEAALRFGWHLRYSNKFAKSAFSRPAKTAARGAPAGNRAAVTERLKRMEREWRGSSSSAKSESPDPRSGKGKEKPLSCSSSSSEARERALSLKDMRPASAATRQLLYSGISAHGEGRYAYLRKRKSLTPERKYEFPILSSCQYGWKIMEFANPKPSPHARTCVIKDSFYRNSGIILG